MQTDLKTLSKDELSTEETTIRQQSNSSNNNNVANNTNSKTVNSSNSANATDNNNAITINDLSQSLDGDKTSIIFNDPLNNSLVKLNLSSENIDKLQKHFSSDNFYKEDDGSIRLNGDANSFVSGWFGDIAYKREFLSADANKDGKLSDSEYGNTKNGYTSTGYAQGIGNTVLSLTENIDETYTKVHTKLSDSFSSIESAVNFTLKSDSDFNNKITVKEDIEASGKNYRKTIIDNARKHLENTTSTTPAVSNWLVDWDTIFKEQPSEEQAKALQKLKSANGDESVLSDDEKKAIQDQLSAIKKELEKQKDSSGSSNLENNTAKDNQTTNNGSFAKNDSNSNIASKAQTTDTNTSNTLENSNITNTNNNITKQSDLSSVVSEIKATLTESSSFIDERV